MSLDDIKDVYTIGQISQLLEVKEHTIRFWEKEFPLVDPIRKSNGRREYTRQDFLLLQHIKKLLYEEGYTAKGALKELMALSKGDKNIHLYEESDLFSDTEKISPANLKQTSSSQAKKAQHIAESNTLSSKGLSGIQKEITNISKQVDQMVWIKFYHKINHLIEFLEKK